jgi:RNA polymerase sigma-70 factor (sigma-E family)
MAGADVEGEFTAYAAAQLPGLRRTAFLLCQDWHRADDLAQTALTRLFIHWRRASSAGNTDAYLRAILLNVFLGEQRTGWWKRTRPHAEPARAAAFPRPSAPPDLDALLDLRAALEQLPPRRRAAVVLRYYCDLSIEQTARLLGCSEGTIKSQTSKALAQLRGALDPLADFLSEQPSPGSAEAARAAVARPADLNAPISPSTPGRTR